MTGKLDLSICMEKNGAAERKTPQQWCPKSTQKQRKHLGRVFPMVAKAESNLHLSSRAQIEGSHPSPLSCPSIQNLLIPTEQQELSLPSPSPASPHAAEPLCGRFGAAAGPGSCIPALLCMSQVWQPERRVQGVLPHQALPAPGHAGPHHAALVIIGFNYIL